MRRVGLSFQELGDGNARQIVARTSKINIVDRSKWFAEMIESEMPADDFSRATRKWSWDLFCRVIDNLGDIGTCWRLARQLVHDHGQSVRLWVDDLGPLAQFCPTVSIHRDSQIVDSIEIHRWQADFPDVRPADVVIEAFACEIPQAYVDRMAQRANPSVWMNLEYLTAEDWVENCHLLPSPHPTLPLTKYFFFPGFTAKSGGLLRERDLIDLRASFDLRGRTEFLRSINVVTADQDELLISLFCYENPALPELLNDWSAGPRAVRLLTTPGFATNQVQACLQENLSSTVQAGALTVQAIPYLSQPNYDRLLWSCDFNFVRGEDSFVRAQWACQPFVWQIYPQAEKAHLVKLDAFLSKYLARFEPSSRVRDFWHAWNGAGRIEGRWSELIQVRQSLQEHAKQWAEQLDRTGNLANNLVLFVQNRC